VQQKVERSEVGIVFWVSSAVALAFILWGVIAPESFGVATQAIFNWVVSNLGWFYLLAGNFFLIFVVLLALSSYGKFRLGKEGERPEFSNFAWFAMLFQAGMGPALQSSSLRQGFRAKGEGLRLPNPQPLSGRCLPAVRQGYRLSHRI
jgi:choline-glycine betaine transporter